MANQVQDTGPPRLEDYFFSFEGGMDTGSAPLLLQPNQMAYCSNGTVRGDFLQPRPPFKIRQMIWDGPPTQATVEGGLFQGACYYLPDATTVFTAALVAAISGRLFLFTPAATTITVKDITPANDSNSATQPQAWLWQAEQFVVWNDGLAAPIFYNGTTQVSVRSNYVGQTGFTDTVANPFTCPAVNATVNITFASGLNMVVNDILILAGFGHFKVQSGVAPTFLCVNVDSQFGVGSTVAAGTVVNWQHKNFQLPPGRMGAYVLGRNWFSLLDGKQFVASDMTGGASGTFANNYRDAVLSITENTFLVGGGNFSVPGSAGDIRAIVALPTIDASLGQGPVMVFTPKSGFSCNSPTDRTTWTSIQNPILTAAMLTNAALGQNSTIAANGDILMRALEGVRSLVMTRNDFTTWGNTIISNELLRVMPKDNAALLQYLSSTVFNNRSLWPVGPIQGPNGVYNQAMAVLNFDPKSNLSGKLPSVWESVWNGIFPMQFVTGTFSQVERCFAFCFNPTNNKTEIHEILTDDADIVDDTNTAIALTFEGPVLFKDKDPRQRLYKRLFNGEIYVEDLQGTVKFYVFYRPDSYPAWIPWYSWTECQTRPTGTPGTANYQPGYRPRMGLGEPNGNLFDPCSNRPFREAFTFQVKIEIVGHCIFQGGRFECIQLPRATFAKLSTDPICP